MALSSLSRMSVALATDQSARSQGQLMPKLQYRFRVVFENLGVSTPRSELTKQVMDFKRPSVSFAGIDVHTYNSMLRLAGKHTWDDVSCNIRDDASGSVAKLVGEQLRSNWISWSKVQRHQE